MDISYDTQWSLRLHPHLSPQAAGTVTLALEQALHALSEADEPAIDRCRRHIQQALQAHRHDAAPKTAEPLRPRGLADWQISLVENMMAGNYDQALPTTAMASACGLSRGYFTRAFKISFGKPPHKWRMSLRLRHARTLLRDHRHTLADIAGLCGFTDQAHFSRIFKADTGVSPLVWRNREMASAV